MNHERQSPGGGGGGMGSAHGGKLGLGSKSGNLSIMKGGRAEGVDRHKCPLVGKIRRAFKGGSLSKWLSGRRGPEMKTQEQSHRGGTVTAQLT